jgi:hypothetical protein
LPAPLQLHALCLASAASLTRESSRPGQFIKLAGTFANCLDDLPEILFLSKHNIFLISHEFYEFYAGILYLKGEPILLHLRRYRPFAVKDHSGMPCALHLHPA